MERKIGEKFECKGISCIVRENAVEVHGWMPRGRGDCNSRCVFWNGRNCEGLLSITGDCQTMWREDKKTVFFEDAALARSPLGAAAANSDTILIDASKILHLHLKAIWYDMIRRGEKKEEYREDTEYWRKRLDGKDYSHILFYYGYTKTRMLVPILYRSKGIGTNAWGAPSDERVYIFGLGEIIDENRWKILRDV